MNTKKHAQCLKLNIIYSSGVQLKHVLDTPDLQNYSRKSNPPKMPIIKFRTFEHFLKFLPDAKFNPKFRTCPEFSELRGNPSLDM